MLDFIGSFMGVISFPFRKYSKEEKLVLGCQEY